MAEYFRVKEAFAYGNAVVSAGEIWSDDNPAFRGRELFFEPIAAAASRVTPAAVETATASPGEVRAVSRPRRGRRSHTETPTPPAPVVDPSPQEDSEDA